MSIPFHTNSLDDDNESADVISEIEKFIQESEIPSKMSLVNRKSGLFASDAELLRILSPEVSTDKSIIMNKIFKLQASVSPKRRKIEDNCETEAKFQTQIKRRRGRPPKSIRLKYIKGKLRFSQIPKLEHSSAFPGISYTKRKIERVVTHHREKHIAKILSVVCRYDSKICRNIKIKEEIIDLTGDDTPTIDLNAMLKFAFICNLESFQMAVLIDSIEAKAEIVTVTNNLESAKVLRPKIEFHIDKHCYDLTSESEDEENIVSEKECVNAILPILYCYHKVQDTNKQLESIIDEESVWTLKLFSKQSSFLSEMLMERLSRIFVRNLNESRFIEILTSKFNTKYNDTVTASLIINYLQTMYIQAQGNCKKSFAKQFFIKINRYVDELRVKEECYQNRQVFTNEQLELLVWQIEKYKEITRELLNANQVGFHPEIGFHWGVKKLEKEF